MFLVVVNVAHSQQVGIAGSKHPGLNKQMECISAHRLYYVIVKLVCKTHRGVTWREFRKRSQKSLKMVKIRCTPTLKGPIL